MCKLKQFSLPLRNNQTLIEFTELLAMHLGLDKQTGWAWERRGP